MKIKINIRVALVIFAILIGSMVFVACAPVPTDDYGNPISREEASEGTPIYHVYFLTEQGCLLTHQTTKRAYISTFGEDTTRFGVNAEEFMYTNTRFLMFPYEVDIDEPAICNKAGE